MTGITIEIYMANDTLCETTLVPPTVTIEEQVHHKSTVVHPTAHQRYTSNKILQGDWAARDQSIFIPPSQQQLPGTFPKRK